MTTMTTKDVTAALSTSTPKADAETKKPTFEELYTEDIATILVGPEKKVFRVYKALLCHESSYFRAALNSGFKEGIECKVELPEEVKIFSVFFKWIFTSKIFLDDVVEAPQVDGVVEVQVDDVDMGTLVKTYVFADMLGVPRLMNLCIDTIVALVKNTATVWPTNFLYENTLPGSGLRRLHLDVFVWHCSKTIDTAQVSHLSSEFVAELLGGLHKRPTLFEREDVPYCKDVCQYHVHAPGERCLKS